MTEFWPWLTGNFNNRELAGAIWITVLLLLFFIRREGRKGIWGIVQAIIAPKLLILFAAFAANIAFLAWLGLRLGVWETGLLAPTVVWYFFGGLPLLARSFDAKEGTQHFRGYVKDALSGTAILEFLYVAKTFGFVVELFLVPMVTFLAMLVVFSERQKEYAKVNSLLSIILAIFVLAVIWYSISQVLDEPDTFFTTKTFRAFLLPIYFTALSIPFFYLLHCYSHIEGARIQIELKSFQSDEVKAYARKRFCLIFPLRPWFLRRAVRQFHNMPARSKEDVDKIINDILKYEREAESPPPVDPSTGWSPFLARDFLTEEGIRTGDYHPGYEGDDWWSGVSSKELDDSVFPGTANYSFSGVEGLVTQLKLRGHFMDDFVTEVALDEFSRLSQRLLARALINVDVEDAMQRLPTRQPFQAISGNTTIELKRERFHSGKGFELVLEVGKTADSHDK